MVFRPSPGTRGFLTSGVLATAAVLGLVLTASFFMARGQVSTETGVGADMPMFTSTLPERWLNTKPLTTASLRGNVVLLEVWTSI